MWKENRVDSRLSNTNYWTHFKAAASSNLIWRVTAIVNEQEEILVEERIVGNVQPGLVYTVSYSLAFGTDGEGVI